MKHKFWIASIVVFLIWFVGAGAINGLVLMEDWFKAASFVRPWDVAPPGSYSEIDLYHYMVIPFVLYAFASVWLYRRGVRKAPWVAQGAIFGLVIACITIIPMRLLNYVTFDFVDGGLIVPSAVLVKEVVAWTIMLVGIGVVIAWFYRAEASAAED